MNIYEHKIARGKTLDELSESMNEIANIRNVEIDAAVIKGFEVISSPHEWFTPVGKLSFINGEYLQVMRRII